MYYLEKNRAIKDREENNFHNEGRFKARVEKAERISS